MGKERVEGDGKKGRDRWPFDPLQPGDHEPVRLPEELERLQERARGQKGSNER